MAKRKGKLSAFVKSFTKTRKIKNPDGDGGVSLPALNFVVDAGAGVVGYAATSVAGNIVSGVAARKVAWGRHLAPLASLLAAVLVWVAAGKIRALRKYQMGLLIGSGIAVLHSAVKTWLPGLGTLLGVSQPVVMIPSVKPARRVGSRLPEGVKDLLTTGTDFSEPQEDENIEFLDDDEDELYQGSLAKN